MSIKAKLLIRRGSFALKADFEAEAGITALFGPSGCGKTSLLRAVAGLDKHLGSSLSVAGAVWQQGQQFLPTYKRSLGYVFQEPSLFSHLNAEQNVRFGMQRRKLNNGEKQFRQAVELLGLSKLLARSVDRLSGGEQQRVAIARALVTQPELLLLDEPLAALDEAGKQEIFPYLESLHRSLEIPVLYVSHSITEVARLADQIILFGNGGIAAQGATADMLTRPELSLAHSNDAGAILDCQVSAIDSAFGLTTLASAAGDFTVVNRDLQIGQTLRLHVAARDVSITLQPAADSSILNVLPATVLTINAENSAQVLVQLQTGDSVLLARITKKSAQQLALNAEKLVYAQIKSVALF